MGPEATASLYLNIINRCQRNLHAKYNSDFPPVIINSFPVPDGRMWKGFEENEVKRSLARNVRLLEQSGVDFIAIPCNSAHHFLPAMRKAVHIPILSIVEETAEEIRRRKINKVLLLATKFTMNRQIYDKSLADHAIILVKPRSIDQHVINNITIRVESGHRNEADKTKIIKIVDEMKRKTRIQAVIGGCTEIPLLIKSRDISLPLIDTIDILAKSCYEMICGRPL